jgi:hypothetical protein
VRDDDKRLLLVGGMFMGAIGLLAYEKSKLEKKKEGSVGSPRRTAQEDTRRRLRGGSVGQSTRGPRARVVRTTKLATSRGAAETDAAVEAQALAVQSKPKPKKGKKGKKKKKKGGQRGGIGTGKR